MNTLFCCKKLKNKKLPFTVVFAVIKIFERKRVIFCRMIIFSKGGGVFQKIFPAPRRSAKSI